MNRDERNPTTRKAARSKASTQDLSIVKWMVVLLVLQMLEIVWQWVRERTVNGVFVLFVALYLLVAGLFFWGSRSAVVSVVLGSAEESTDEREHLAVLESGLRASRIMDAVCIATIYILWFAYAFSQWTPAMVVSLTLLVVLLLVSLLVRICLAVRVERNL